MIKFKFRAILSSVLVMCLFTSMAAPGHALAEEKEDSAVSLMGDPRSALVNWVTDLASDVGQWNKPWNKDTYNNYTLVLPRDKDSFSLTPKVSDTTNIPTLTLYENVDGAWQELSQLTSDNASDPISIAQGERRLYKLKIVPSSGNNPLEYEFTCYRSTVRMQLQVDQPQKDADGNNRVSVRLVGDVASEKEFHLGSIDLNFQFPADKLQMDNGSGDNQYGNWHEQIKSKMKPQGTPILNNETGKYALSLIANRLSTGGGVEDIGFNAGGNVLAAFSFVVKDGVLFDPGDIRVSVLHYSDGINANAISMRNMQDDATGDFFETVKTTAPIINNLVPQGLDGSNSELIRETTDGGQGFTSTCTDYTLNFTSGMQALAFIPAYDDENQSLVVERVDKQGNSTQINGGASVGDGETVSITIPQDGDTILFRTSFLATPGNSTTYRVQLKLMDIKLNYQQPELDGSFYKIPITVGQDTKLAGVHFRLILPQDAQFEKSESALGNFYIIAQQEGLAGDGKKYIDIDLISASSGYVDMTANELLFTVFVSVPDGSTAPACELTNVIVLTKDADIPAGVAQTKSMALTVSAWNPNDSIEVKVYSSLNGSYADKPVYNAVMDAPPINAKHDTRFEQQVTFQVPADQPFKVELSKARHLTYVLEFGVGGADVANTVVLPCGDVDTDGITSQADRNLLLAVIARGVTATEDLLAKYDLDGDGRLSQADLNILSMDESFNKRPEDARMDFRPSAP